MKYFEKVYIVLVSIIKIERMMIFVFEDVMWDFLEIKDRIVIIVLYEERDK